ncbi:MAG: DMT family transporter [Spirochaetales bacterium]|nr:DMT family transporter [Spirochaetales bacterium]
MILMIVVALTNGLLVTVSRIMNARLGREITPAGASVWNHLTGTLLMGIFFLLFNNQEIHMQCIPVYAYLGGIIGAVYVTVANFLIPRLGASKATILMIGGQILLATLIDYLKDAIGHPLTAVSGIILIILGIYVGERSKEAVRTAEEKS